MNRYQRSAAALQRLRARIFAYDDTPKEAQAERVLLYLKARKLRGRKLRGRRDEAVPPAYRVGPYSGLTRRELAASGTCETDWY